MKIKSIILYSLLLVSCNSNTSLNNNISTNNLKPIIETPIIELKDNPNEKLSLPQHFGYFNVLEKKLFTFDKNGKLEYSIPITSNENYRLAPDKSKVAIVYEFKEITIVDLKTNKDKTIFFDKLPLYDYKWSPNSDKLALILRGEKNNYSLKTVNLKGEMTNIANEVETNYSWSYDGKKLIFIENKTLYMINSDGSNKTKLKTINEENVEFELSPNNKHLIFAYFDKSNKYTLKLLNLETLEEKFITATNYARFKWFKNGKNFSFLQIENNSNSNIISNVDNDTKILLDFEPSDVLSKTNKLIYSQGLDFGITNFDGSNKLIFEQLLGEEKYKYLLSNKSFNTGVIYDISKDESKIAYSIYQYSQPIVVPATYSTQSLSEGIFTTILYVINSDGSKKIKLFEKTGEYGKANLEFSDNGNYLLYNKNSIYLYFDADESEIILFDFLNNKRIKLGTGYAPFWF